MTSTRSLEQGLAEVDRLRAAKQYDAALGAVEKLLESWPGNPQLYLQWASLVQLQENPTHSLSEAKKALQRAVAVDKNSPAGAIELGHFLYAVDDNAPAAARSFAEGVRVARSLLIDGLLGQAQALLEQKRKADALRCVLEALYLANNAATDDGESATGTPDVLVRDFAGRLLAYQVKGPFAAKVEDLLAELFPKRSA